VVGERVGPEPGVEDGVVVLRYICPPPLHFFEAAPPLSLVNHVSPAPQPVHLEGPSVPGLPEHDAPATHPILQHSNIAAAGSARLMWQGKRMQSRG
jgi:hypothetical protein